MPKKSEKEAEETEAVAGAVAKDVNAFLKEEEPDDDEEYEEVAVVVDSFSTTTKLLGALADVVAEEFEDEVGAAMIREFRVRFAAHEMETL